MRFASTVKPVAIISLIRWRGPITATPATNGRSDTATSPWQCLKRPQSHPLPTRHRPPACRPSRHQQPAPLTAAPSKGLLPNAGRLWQYRHWAARRLARKRRRPCSLLVGAVARLGARVSMFSSVNKRFNALFNTDRAVILCTRFWPERCGAQDADQRSHDTGDLFVTHYPAYRGPVSVCLDLGLDVAPTVASQGRTMQIATPPLRHQVARPFERFPLVLLDVTANLDARLHGRQPAWMAGTWAAYN